MNTKAVRLYGKNDLRLEEFELPAITDEEVLVRVVSNSICMSSHKAALQGTDHKRVPKDVAEHPVIIGHEFCGEIVQVGAKWQDQFRPGEKFTVQPALNYKGSLASPGYSYRYCGGNATYCILPHEVMELGCLLPYNGDAYFYGSLSEPVSCIVGAFHAAYHTKPCCYVHEMGIREGGVMGIFAGAGPMGVGAIDYALGCACRPAMIVVTDVDDARLRRAEQILSPAYAEQKGVRLVYVNTGRLEDPEAYLRELSGGAGFDDIFVYAPVSSVIELADRLLARDGCLNFFAGPNDKRFSASLNFYNVHYTSTHIVGTTGGSTDDMREALSMMEEGRINPAAMVTHIGGLNAVADTIVRLDKIPGGKKLIYTGKRLPLSAIDDFGRLGESDPFFAALHEICSRHNGLWCAEAERYLLEHAPNI